MPYVTSGSLTTDQQTTSSSTGWDTQSEWESYQSKTDVTITDGTIHLTETPTDIPDFEDLHAHYDATALSLSDGDNVSTWADGTGNGNDLTAGTAPQYVTNGPNGNPFVKFDPSNSEYLDVSFSPLSQPNTVFVVGRYVGGSNQRLFQSPDGSNRNQIDTTISGNYGVYAGSTLNSGTSPDTNWHILGALFNGSNSTHRVGGSQIASGDAGSEGMGGIRLAADPGLNEYGDVEIGEILVYPQDKSSIQSDVENYLNYRWGVI